jgi:hypothetical protein
MAYVISNPVGGGLPGINSAGATQFGTQGIDERSTVQRYPLGTRVRGIDPVYGEAEFVYCLGVASNRVGSAVRVSGAFATTLAVAAGIYNLVGVSMSAFVANEYGWVCIFGSVPVRAGTVVAGTQAYLTATPDTLDDAVVAGDNIMGAAFRTADGTPSAGLAILTLTYASTTDVGA